MSPVPYCTTNLIGASYKQEKRHRQCLQSVSRTTYWLCDLGYGVNKGTLQLYSVSPYGVPQRTLRAISAVTASKRYKMRPRRVIAEREEGHSGKAQRGERAGTRDNEAAKTFLKTPAPRACAPGHYGNFEGVAHFSQANWSCLVELLHVSWRTQPPELQRHS